MGISKKWRLIIFLTLFNVGIIYALTTNYKLLINTSYSLDNFAFIVKKNALPQQAGEYIAFNAPSNQLYDKPFVKIVAGIPGDRLEVRNRVFYINGKEICRAKEYSKTGMPLEIGPTGVLPPGSYFVYSPNKDSYDSRYKNVGWVKSRDIIGIATPIL
jgi:conjugal transfer pilin signal peptidase TrbI